MGCRWAIQPGGCRALAGARWLVRTLMALAADARPVLLITGIREPATATRVGGRCDQLLVHDRMGLP